MMMHMPEIGEHANQNAQNFKCLRFSYVLDISFLGFVLCNNG